MIYLGCVEGISWLTPGIPITLAVFAKAAFFLADAAGNRMDRAAVPQVCVLIQDQELVQRVRADQCFSADVERRDTVPANQLPEGVPADARVLGCFLDGQCDLFCHAITSFLV